MSESPSGVRLQRSQGAGASITMDLGGAGDSLVGIWKGLGVAAPLVLHRSPRSPPPAITVDSIAFHNGAITLAGSVYSPAGAHGVPGVVEIHGSGPDTRAKYENKAVYLARRGVAVLVFDKRGTGGSTGDWATASMTDLAQDALAGVAALRRHPGVDPHLVGVEGFSQGGWIAPLAATLDSGVAFVVVGSASGINAMAQSIYDVQNAMHAAGDPDSIVRLAVSLRERLYASPRGEPRRRLNRELQRYSTETWFSRSVLPDSLSDSVPPGVRAFLHFEPEPTWRQVRVPVLAYWGEKDINVPAARSHLILSRALRAAGNRDTTFLIYPGSDHGMTRPLAHPARIRTLPRVFPSYELIGDWLEKRFIHPQPGRG